MSRLLPNLRHCARSCAARIADRTPTHSPPQNQEPNKQNRNNIGDSLDPLDICCKRGHSYTWGKRLLRVGDVARSVEAAQET